MPYVQQANGKRIVCVAVDPIRVIHMMLQEPGKLHKIFEVRVGKTTKINDRDYEYFVRRQELSTNTKESDDIVRMAIERVTK